jgi:hypothetical protein
MQVYLTLDFEGLNKNVLFYVLLTVFLDNLCNENHLDALFILNLCPILTQPAAI